jgi:hypothetical protein
MKKDLTLYPEALELKQLGFAEPCFAWYDSEYQDIPYYDHANNSDGWLFGNNCSAPSYSQAFRWFREKHDIGHSIDEDWDNGHLLGYEYVIYQQEGVTVSKTYHTYEEAERACLKELIEIAKGGNK